METLQCPICHQVMIAGRSAVIKNIITKINWPFHSDHLFFKPIDDSQDSEVFIKEGPTFISHKCAACDVLLITKEKYKP